MPRRSAIAASSATALLLCLGTAALAAENVDAEARTKSCLSLARIRSTEVLDAQHILFKMNDGSMYLSTLPHRCPGLNRHSAYMHKTSLPQVCDLDIITVLDSMGNGFMRGASCGLGEFVPVEQSAVDTLREDLKSLRKSD